MKRYGSLLAAGVIAVAWAGCTDDVNSLLNLKNRIDSVRHGLDSLHLDSTRHDGRGRDSTEMQRDSGYVRHDGRDSTNIHRGDGRDSTTIHRGNDGDSTNVRHDDGRDSTNIRHDGRDSTNVRHGGDTDSTHHHGDDGGQTDSTSHGGDDGGHGGSRHGHH